MTLHYSRAEFRMQCLIAALLLIAIMLAAVMVLQMAGAQVVRLCAGG